MLDYITSWDTALNYSYASKVTTYIDTWCATSHYSINNDKAMTLTEENMYEFYVYNDPKDYWGFKHLQHER